MSVADTGFLVAIVNPSDTHHRRCAATMHDLRSQMISTWPVIAEAMYLLGRTGWHLQDRLWQLLDRGAVGLHDVTPPLAARCRELMANYRDLPMDLADATLVALAEAEQDWQVLTLDQHFRLYRPRGRSAFDILPRDQ